MQLIYLRHKQIKTAFIYTLYSYINYKESQLAKFSEDGKKYYDPYNPLEQLLNISKSKIFNLRHQFKTQSCERASFEKTVRKQFIEQVLKVQEFYKHYYYYKVY